MLKKLLSHGFLYSIGPQVPKIANIFVLPIITLYLTPLDYGIYGTVLAYSAIFGGMKSLGFDILLVNSFYKKNSWKLLWGRYMGFLLAFNVLFFFIYSGALYLLIPSEVGNNKWLLIFLIGIPSLFLDIVNMFGGRYFQLLQKPKFLAITTSISGVVTIFLNLYTIAILKLGYMGWFISTAAGTTLIFLFYLYPIFAMAKIKVSFSGTYKFWKRSLSVSLPTVPHNYSAYLLNSSDRLVLDRLNVPVSQIGIYNLAYIFGGYMEVFGTAIGMAVGPYITSLYAKKNKSSEQQVQTLIFFLLVSFILVCSLIALWAKEIFQILIKNDDLIYAYPLAVIIIMGYSYRPLYWAGVSKLLFYELTSKLWRVSFVAGVLNVVLNLVFIPFYGIYAAAVTTFISLFYLAVAPYYIKEYRKMDNARFYPFQWLLFILLLTIAIYIFRDIGITYKLLVSVFFILAFVVYFLKQRNKIQSVEI